MKDYILKKLKEYKPQAIRFGIVIALIIAGKSTTVFLKWHDDNAVEQAIERLIYSKTGIELDLTPDEDGFIKGIDKKKLKDAMVGKEEGKN